MPNLIWPDKQIPIMGNIVKIYIFKYLEVEVG